MDTISEAAEQVSRKARRAAKSTAKDMVQTAKQARKAARDAANVVLQGEQPKRRRRWPWLLGVALMAAAAAGATYAMRGRQQTTSEASEPEADRSAMNGAAPHPRREQPTESPAGHNN
jgi:hypothetical protein